MRAIVLTIIALSLAACAGDRGLRELRSSTGGPDEFLVSPNAPLELPENFELPSPTPGAVNLTDINPNANAVARTRTRGAPLLWLGSRSISRGRIDPVYPAHGSRTESEKTAYTLAIPPIR